jgi:Ca2+-transporting ATPase
MNPMPEKIKGLTAIEAKERLDRFGYNELPSSRARSLWKLIAGILSEPMFILLVSCAALYLILGDLQEALVLSASVVIVMAIELVQERKTEKALDALKNLASPRALVIRDGVRIRIPGREVVVDDLIVLAEGDRVPADAYILENSQLNIDESLLTGESVPVRKRLWDGNETPLQAGGDDLPCVYSGTLVVSGVGIGKVFATGQETELGKIGKSLESFEEETTKLSRDTGKLVKQIAIIAIAICALVVIVYYLSRGNLIESFLTGITLAMSVLPEEFPVVLTVFMALGAWRMSKKNVLTRRTQAIENLGSATVLCTDKTGTLTYNRMTVQMTWGDSGPCHLDTKSAESMPDSCRNILFHSVLASVPNPFDPMEKAMHTALQEQDPAAYERFSELQLVKEYPLSDELRAMTNVWKMEGSGDLLAAAKGAPEAIISLCKLDQLTSENLMKDVAAMAGDGLRVLGIASVDVEPHNFPTNQRELAFRFMGFVGLADPVRESVPAAVSECYRAGIRVIMITGDYVGTAKAIGRKIGLRNLDNVISGDELNAMSDEELAQKIKATSIFARVVPEQKLRIVQALKSNQEVVAMTGDGVNDTPALKAANIGISMGQRGTDVAREASAIVLTDDDFSSIVSAVRMGRRIYDNLRKSFVYVFSLHMPIAGMALIPAMLADFPLIFYPVHIAFLELIIDPACSIVFEMENEEANIMDRPPRDPNAPLFGKKMLSIGVLQGLGVLALLVALYFFGVSKGFEPNRLRALVFTTMVFSNIMLIATNRSWSKNLFKIFATPNKAMLFLILGVLVVVLLATHVPALINIFHLARLSLVELLICLVVGNIGVLWFEVYKFINRKKAII